VFLFDDIGMLTFAKSVEKSLVLSMGVLCVMLVCKKIYRWECNGNVLYSNSSDQF